MKNTIFKGYKFNKKSTIIKLQMGISMIWDNLRKFYILVIALLTMLMPSCNSVFAAARKVPTIVVLTDSAHRNGTKYIICGAASDIIATDIINRLNQTGRIKAPLLGENMSKVTSGNFSLYKETFFNEYKYNYNVDFVNLKRITRYVNADYILMITSGLDTQSQLLKENWWSKISWSAGDPITPRYRLTTLLTLIDKKTYSIVWQDMYQRSLKADDMDLGITQFSPSYPQLAKIKKYSNTMSEYVVNNIDKVVNPWTVPPEEPKSVEMRSRFVNEGTKVYYPAVNGEVVKENFNEFKTDTQKKWNDYQKQRKQKQHIENVRRLERKRQMEEIKQLELKNKQYEAESKAKNKSNSNKSFIVPIKNQNQSSPLQKDSQGLQWKQKKQEQRLFDTIDSNAIENNIDDMTNTLPAPRKQEELRPINTEPKPAIELKPVKQQEEPAIIKPSLDKPVVKEEAKKPASNIQKSQPAQQKEIQQEEQKQLQQEEHTPYYDWNLKNIYLEKIGRLSNLH